MRRVSFSYKFDCSSFDSSVTNAFKLLKDFINNLIQVIISLSIFPTEYNSLPNVVAQPDKRHQTDLFCVGE